MSAVCELCGKRPRISCLDLGKIVRGQFVGDFEIRGSRQERPIAYLVHGLAVHVVVCVPSVLVKDRLRKDVMAVEAVSIAVSRTKRGTIELGRVNTIQGKWFRLGSSHDEAERRPV